METKKIHKCLIEYYNEKKSLLQLSKDIKVSRSFLRKEAKTLGLDFSKLRGNKINKFLLVDKHFGMLHVEKFHSRNERGSIWKCKCECGNIVYLPAGRLTRSKGGAISCGCQSNKNKPANKSKFWKGIGTLSSTRWSQIKRNAKKRNIIFDITMDVAYDVYLEQNKKCKLTGIEITMEGGNNIASLDRIDSTLPYVLGNIQWVDKRINYMKHSLSQFEFINLCKLVTKYNKN